MSAFFVGWALWEKMTFVLALCFVVAIGLGGCKNMYTRWRLRQYTSVSIKHPTPTMVEAQTAGEVPFGIKAIESGVEVEGVWISRSNTPVPSGSNSLNNSPASSARASVASSIFLNDIGPMPDSAYSQSDKSRRHSSIKPSWTNTKASAPAVLERDRSTERLVPETSRSRLPYTGSSRSRHTSMPVMSRLRESMTLSPQPDYNRESSGSMSDQVSHRPSSEPRPSTDPSTSLDSSGSSSRSYQRASQYTYTEPSSELEPQPLAWRRENKGKGRMMESGADLRLLQSHRMSHVAETGQLGHRTRRVGNASNGRTRSANLEPPKPEPELELESEAESEPEADLPDLDLTLPTLSQVDLHFETTSSTFSAPVPRGLFETPLPPHLDSMSDYSSELDLGVIQDVIRTKYLDEPRPRCPSPASRKERPRTSGERRSFQAERDSKILRNVNSSFQVLHPGTFAPPVVESAPSNRDRSSDRSRRHSRRLRRRQGSTSSSRRTSFIEIIYGNERHPS